MGWISDIIGIGGKIIDYRSGRKLDANRALVSRFNRQLDMFNLAMTKKHLDYDQRINKLLAAESFRDAAQAGLQQQFHLSEAGQYAAQRGFSQWMTRSRIREMESITRREMDTAWLQLGVKATEHRDRGAVLGFQEHLLNTRREAQAAVEEAQLGTVATRQVSARQRVGAQRATVAARMGAVGAERALIARGGEFRRQARIEQGAREIGAAAVSGAARGIRGSYQRTAGAVAVRDLGRDLEMFRLEDGLKMLQNVEAGAKAVAAGVDVERTFADEQARLGAEQARLVSEGEVARAGFDVESARRMQARGVHGAEGRLIRGQVEELGARRGFLDERIEREERKGLIEAAGYSLREAGSRLQAGEAARRAEKARIKGQSQTYEVWLGDTARQINRWQMQQLPTLPDYEGQGTRSAMATLLNIASEVID